MDRITQEAQKRQAMVEYEKKYGKSEASRQYGVSLSSVKRWTIQYAGTWQSLAERSHRPLCHPKQHTAAEEAAIRTASSAAFFRYGWDGVYDDLVKNHGYTRSYSGMYHAAKRTGLAAWYIKKRRAMERRYPECQLT